ncbi:reverse transcriptase domain-containing protein [Tanacetum coccineum]
MKLNPKKCTFGAEEGAFLSHVVSMQGIKVCPEKTEAVMKLQSPQTLKEAQSLNGKLASLNKFLSKSAEKSLPFFKTLKRCIKRVTSTREAVSAVLLAERNSRQVRVYFVIRALQTPEINYSSMKKLVLALVHATRRLRRYFQAHPVVMEAFDITYRPRTSIRSQILANFIAEKPNEDGPLMEVKAEEIKVIPGTMVAMRRSNASEIRVNEIHEGSCNMHFGPRSMVAKATRSGYYSSTMHKVARNIIRACNDCQTHRPVPRNPQQKLTPITSPWPFYKWGIDISGPFPEGQGKVNFLIVAIDYFTKWIEENPVATITRNQVKKFIWDNIVCRFGLLREIISDTEISSEITHSRTGEGIKARLGEDNRNWVEKVSHVLWAHRTMIKTSNRDTPFSLTYGTEAVIPVEIGMPSIRCAEVNHAKNDEEPLLNLDILEERRENAAVREAKNKAKMEKY